MLEYDFDHGQEFFDFTLCDSEVHRNVSLEFQDNFCKLYRALVDDLAERTASMIFIGMDGGHNNYHSPIHIITMLTELNRLEKKGDIEQNLMLHLAIWFHDVHQTLDSIPGYNEYNSAQYLYSIFKDKGIDVSEAVDLVLATKDYDDINTHPKYDLIMDLDLIMFSWDWDKYILAEEAIQREYAHLCSPETYLKGRFRLLWQFLTRRSIYRSTLFCDLYEEKAKDNINKRVDIIEKQLDEIEKHAK